jgi:hypothetical protein
MIVLLKNLLKKITLKIPTIQEGLTNKTTLNEPEYYFKSFGKLNKDKIFYLIKRSPGTGLFSNVTFVLNHLKICKKLGFIPVVDMENYNTIYNEKISIKNTWNAWEYYFQQLSPYDLKEVYKSKNVLITNDKFYHFFRYNMNLDKELTQIFRDDISIEKILAKSIVSISKKFQHKRVLGIHFRGTSYKKTAGHPLPATKKQMLAITNKILNDNKIDKIFLVTEELSYLNFFKENFPEKLIYLKSCYRSNKDDAFKIYPRNLHRYKLGREALIETVLLSKCDFFLYLSSNISSAAISLNLNSSQKRIEIKNGNNSKNRLFSQFYWYLKAILPRNLGGL